MLVYSEVGDRFWGSGLQKYDLYNKKASGWLGRNELGMLLMDIRKELMRRPEHKDLIRTIEKEKEKAQQKKKNTGGEFVPMKKYKTVP